MRPLSEQYQASAILKTGLLDLELSFRKAYSDVSRTLSDSTLKDQVKLRAP